MEEEAEVGKCTMCGKEAILSDMFYSDKHGNRITILVCKDCMTKDLVNSIKKG